MCQGLQGCRGENHGAAGEVEHQEWCHCTWSICEEEASHVHELIVVAMPTILPGFLPPRPVLPVGQLVPALGDNSRSWLVPACWAVLGHCGLLCCVSMCCTTPSGPTLCCDLHRSSCPGGVTPPDRLCCLSEQPPPSWEGRTAHVDFCHKHKVQQSSVTCVRKVLPSPHACSTAHPPSALPWVYWGVVLPHMPLTP